MDSFLSVATTRGCLSRDFQSRTMTPLSYQRKQVWYTCTCMCTPLNF